MSVKSIKSRLLMKHDIEANWLKAENFVPLDGEMIIYDADESNERPRVKVGDGETKVSKLPFTTIGVPEVPETSANLMLTTDENGEMIWEERTHYGDGEVVLPEKIYTLADLAGEALGIYTPFEIIVGKEYIVTYQGVEYKAIGQTGPTGASEFAGVGNLGAIWPDEKEDNGLPFLVVMLPADNNDPGLTGGFLPLDIPEGEDESSLALSLSISTGSIKKLDKKYLPNSLFYLEKDVKTIITVEDIGDKIYPIFSNLKEDLIPGKKYNVSFAGQTYEAEAKNLFMEDTDTLVHYLGNLSLPGVPIPGVIDTGETFLFMQTIGSFEEDTPVAQFMTSTSLNDHYPMTLTITKNDVTKIPQEHLPQPDWNANEGEEGYIKNKTHGLGKYIEYFPEMTVELTKAENDAFPNYIITVPMSEIEWIVFDKVFTITYNDVDYNCEFYQVEDSVAAGNLSKLGVPFGNREAPFVLIGNPVGGGVIEIQLFSFDKRPSDTVTLKISNEGTRVQKLDKKFMPDGLLYMEGEAGGTLIAKSDSISSELEGADVSLLYPLEVGRDYTININGEIFNSTCKTYVFSGFTFLYLGNLSNYGNLLPDSGETYLFSTVVDYAEDLMHYSFSNLNELVGKAFTITTSASYSKIPSQFLPTPNWSASNGEEGYIENRTHYYIPELTAHWGGTIEGEFTNDVIVFLGHGFYLYKISNTPSSIPIEKIRDYAKVVKKSGESSSIFPIFKDNKTSFIHLFDMDVPSQGGILSASNNEVYMQFFGGPESVFVRVPSPGIYYLHSAEAIEAQPAFDLVIEEYVQKLDSKFLPDTSTPTIELDTTLKVSGKAADAKAVGDAIAKKVDKTITINGKALNGNIELTASDIGAANEAYVNTAVANLVDSSPEALNTLNELAAALGDDPNFATTVTTELGKKSTATNLVNGAAVGSLRTVNTWEEDDTYSLGTYAFAEGRHSRASGSCSHAEGINAIASGECSHAEGGNTEARGYQSHAEGSYTKAFGDYSHAEGLRMFSSSSYVISGEANTTTYTYTTETDDEPHIGDIIGLKQILGKIESVDKLNKTFIISNTLSAEALDSVNVQKIFGIAYGRSSHSEGASTIAIGDYSHTEGYQTKAVSDASHAEGYCSEALGKFSHAEGYYTTAYENYSHAEGEHTIAQSQKQHVQGKYNIADEEGTYAHIVGNGRSDALRSNAHTLDWNGNGWFAGDVYVGGTGQDDTAANPLIVAPATASVGQTIVVKAIDANGKPTEWECVDIVTEDRVNELIAAALAAIPSAEEASF